MKNVGFVARLLAVAALLALSAFVVAGCGDDQKQDTVSVDRSEQAAGTEAGPSKQFDSGQAVGEAKKVVVDSDAEMSATQQAVISRIGAFGDATANQDYKKLCNDLLSKAARKIGGDCEKTFSQSGESLKDFKITVKSVTVAKDGKSAVAKVSVESNVNKTPQAQDLSLTKEDGDWRIQILGN